jgi:nucleoside-diphosphate-sugar epimerase
MTILVTGASGFIGRHMRAQLAGRPLRLLAHPDDPALSMLQECGAVVTGDLLRPETLLPALEGIDQVIHLAGYVNGGRGHPALFMAVNEQGTANLARAALAAGVQHIVYSSSITVYGHARDADEAAPLVAAPGYPASKIAAEWALREIMPTQHTILRLPLVLGAGDPGFMRPALGGLRRAGRVVIVGSGKQPWSVVAARDAARALALCLDQPATRGATYNVVGETIANGTLLRTIGAGAGCRSAVRVPYLLAWAAAALLELAGRDDLTRIQVAALGHSLSMDGARFARLGFAATVPWRQAIDEAVAEWLGFNDG